jgi:hypothetical protein
MNAAKLGIRRKWQATVKHRGEPPSSCPFSAEDEWNQQWKTLWRDIGKDALLPCPFAPHARWSASSYSCFMMFMTVESAEGGEDYEALVGPIAQHDKEVINVLLYTCLTFCLSALRHQSSLIWC